MLAWHNEAPDEALNLQEVSAVVFRLACLAVLAGLLAPGVAAAPSWRHFSNRQMGFSLRYPAGWQEISSSLPTGKQVLFSRLGTPNYALTVFVPPLHPSKSGKDTLKRFVTYQRSIGNTSFARVRWTSTSLAGKPAWATVLKVSTEGGVPLSTGTLVTQWRDHVYEIQEVSYGRPAPSRISQFPVVYHRMLQSWRFL